MDRCHVGDSNRTVLRYLISRIKGKYRGWIAMPRDKRKAIMAEVVRVHAENRGLYSFVMGSQAYRSSCLEEN